jgi:hypothetical protein
MFVQVIQGRTSDADGLRAAIDRWTEVLAPGAVGWLGTTGGVTEDGRTIALVRFESEEAARRNSERPEQDRWWAETEKLFDGGATFHESTDVVVDAHGDLDQAGFVQVMQGRTSDPGRARQLMAQDPDTWAAFRPDVIGSVEVAYDGGAYTMALYFSSEAEAREREGKEMPLELRATMDEMNKITVEEPEFFDLRQPVLRSAMRSA